MCYKVVRLITYKSRKPALRSAILGTRIESDAFNLEYVPGTPTYPKIGRILVFKHLVDASRFVEDYPIPSFISVQSVGKCKEYQIWYASCDDPQPLSKIMSCNKLTPSLGRKFWDILAGIRKPPQRRTTASGFAYYMSVVPPSGSLSVRSCTLRSLIFKVSFPRRGQSSFVPEFFHVPSNTIYPYYETDSASHFFGLPVFEDLHAHKIQNEVQS